MRITDKYQRTFALNRASWNTRTGVHVRSAFYDVDGFRRGGGSLQSIELEAVGNVKGRSLLHLQCHFGQDTLDWARRGARVVGLDFSDEAVAAARVLASETALDARFVCANVYDAAAAVGETFDLVFTSYGVLGWLPELEPWAEQVAACLKPGGAFHLVEFHPVVWMFDDAQQHVAYHYDGGASLPIEEQSTGTYADRNAAIQTHDVGYNHGLATVITSLLKAGLTIQAFEEFDWSPFAIYAESEMIAPGRYVAKALGRNVPYVYRLEARKPL